MSNISFQNPRGFHSRPESVFFAIKMKGKVLQYEQHYQHFPHNHRDVPLKSLETIRGCNANAKLIQATDERTALIMANDCLQSR